MIDAIALLREYHNALNAFDLGKVQNMFAANIIYASPGVNGTKRGRAEIMLAMRKHFAEFADQVSRDTNIETLGPLMVQSTWQLHATSGITGAKLERRGTEIVTFSNKGLIEKVEVRDKQ